MKSNSQENNDESGEQNNYLFKVGKFEISRKFFYIIVLIYTFTVLILRDKFDSKIAEFLYQISAFAAMIFIIFIIYRMIKVTVIYVKNKYFK